MTPRELAQRLGAVEPLRLQAVSLILEMDAVFGAPVFCTDEMIDRGDEMQAAVNELEDHARCVRKLEKRCSELQPVPSQTPPLGF
jgi:hypothetical protein